MKHDVRRTPPVSAANGPVEAPTTRNEHSFATDNQVMGPTLATPQP